MNIREQREELERQILSPYAALSCNSRGREIPEEQCDIRPVYQRDRDRIIHCKSFRRLKHKTQVFLAPKGDHYRTRLTHVLEVSQIARTVARALKLNEDLVEAIALGHDLGHTPFGHAGERTLNSLCEGGFSHSIQSVRVVEKLEKDGKGLNLTWEVRDGIRNHQLSGKPATLEGQIVRIADKMAYINHDIDDAIRAQILSESDIPEMYHQAIGSTTKERLDCMIHDVIENSYDSDHISMSDEIWEAMNSLRAYMFKHLYTNPAAKSEEVKASEMLEKLFYHYMENVELMPNHFVEMIYEGEPLDRVVCDYIAGMTDQYATNKFQEYFLPKAWQVY